MSGVRSVLVTSGSMPRVPAGPTWPSTKRCSSRAAAGERWLRLTAGIHSASPSGGTSRRHGATMPTESRGSVSTSSVALPVGAPCGTADELTYTVACPVELATLRESYLEIHRMLRDALRSLGVPAELAPTRRAVGVGAGACFATTGGRRDYGERSKGDRERPTAAERRATSARLHPAGRRPADGWRRDARLRARRSGTPLRALLRSNLESDELVEAVSRAAAERWTGTWTTIDSAEEIVNTSTRHAARFRSVEWTWGA